MISETYKASEILNLQFWSLQRRKPAQDQGQENVLMLLAALCVRKPGFPLKELMIAKHSFLSTKLPNIIKSGWFFLQKFSPTRMLWNLQASLAKQHRHANVIVSAAEKRNELKGKG